MRSPSAGLAGLSPAVEYGQGAAPKSKTDWRFHYRKIR